MYDSHHEIRLICTIIQIFYNRVQERTRFFFFSFKSKEQNESVW